MDTLLMAVGATRMRWPKDQLQQAAPHTAPSSSMAEHTQLMEFAFKMGQGAINPGQGSSVVSSSSTPSTSAQAFPPLAIMDDPSRQQPQDTWKWLQGAPVD